MEATGRGHDSPRREGGPGLRGTGRGPGQAPHLRAACSGPCAPGLLPALSTSLRLFTAGSQRAACTRSYPPPPPVPLEADLIKVIPAPKQTSCKSHPASNLLPEGLAFWLYVTHPATSRGLPTPAHTPARPPGFLFWQRASKNSTQPIALPRPPTPPPGLRAASAFCCFLIGRPVRKLPCTRLTPPPKGAALTSKLRGPVR